MSLMRRVEHMVLRRGTEGNPAKHYLSELRYVLWEDLHTRGRDVGVSSAQEGTPRIWTRRNQTPQYSSHLQDLAAQAGSLRQVVSV